jgi:hypothetical protein
MVETLEKYMAEVHAGLREGSVISTHTAHTVEELDSDELWLGLRRELEDVGISPQLLSQKKDFLVSCIKLPSPRAHWKKNFPTTTTTSSHPLPNITTPWDCLR